MCGLIGELRWPETAPPLTLAALRHRGPDASGSWLSPDGSCWLGHTRLAIQDLSSAGAQPIRSRCGRITLVFNGEIYNHLTLRDSLALQSWQGHSDSETLVEGLAQEGLDIVPRLRGMFAFAAYDNQRQELWLARDLCGIKPLYVVWQDGALRFASERRALVGSQPFEAQQLSQLLAWGHLSTPTYAPALINAQVTSLPPGALLRVPRQRPFAPDQIWLATAAEASSDQPPGGQPKADVPSPSLSQARRWLRQQLECTVAEQLLADVPVACFLSSGLDSGILTALACRSRPGAIRSFTVSFPGMPGDESELAAAMARHCGSEHHPVALGEDQVLVWMEAGLRSLDVPTADGLNTYLISRAVAAQGIKVALSGLGADEWFGGYPSHALVPWLPWLRCCPQTLRRRVLQTAGPRLVAKLQDLRHWDVWHFTLAMRRWASDEDLKAAGAEPLDWPSPPPGMPRELWGQISWGEWLGYTEPMLLRDSDVLGMAHSMEIRVPFLDQALVRGVLTLPPRVHRPGKALLRSSCADLFPPGYLSRRKQGFALPMALWMRGLLRPLCMDRLDALLQENWLNPGWVRQQWHAFEAGSLHWTRAWVLVVLGEFAARQSRP